MKRALIFDLEKAKEFYYGVLGLPNIEYEEGRYLFLKSVSIIFLLFNPEDSTKMKSPPS